MRTQQGPTRIRPARRGRWIVPAIAAAALAVSGCASPRLIRWPNVDAPPARAVELEAETHEVGSFEPNLATAIPAAEEELPIDLTTALRLAEAENPLIAEARQRIGELVAQQQRAMVLLLPSLNLGMNLHMHAGNLQRSTGQILPVNSTSLYFGGGAGAVATGPPLVPAVDIVSHLTDAIFEPLAARRRVEASRRDAAATANAILLEVSELFFDLLAAEAETRARRESALEEAEVARLTRAYAEAGQGRYADAERAATELRMIELQLRQAEEAAAVGSARLSHRLHLDQTVRVRPIAPEVEMITLVDPLVPLPALIETALRGRPEIEARAAEVEAAEIRHKQEIYRPFLPTIFIAFSGGAFGGGSNYAPPQLSGFAGRADFDVGAFWTVRNLGLGNLAAQKRREAQTGEAIAARQLAVSQARTEVGAAFADAAAARRRVALATDQLLSARDGFRQDLLRIRNTVGRPIEVVDSLKLLNDARVDRIRAVTDYNKAEFRLFVALGSPPPLGESAGQPVPEVPLASPPLPPPLGKVVPPARVIKPEF